MKYYAIEGSNLSMKGSWMRDLLKGNGPAELEGISGKKGYLFSTLSLEEFIEEELRHDQYDLSYGSGRSILTYSSGEQRKALLDYLINRHPGFLVLDNPFDCLDVRSVKELKNRLIALARKIPIIQIFKRKSDLLPFISHVLIIRKEKIDALYPIEEYKMGHFHPDQALLNSRIPSPAIPYKDIPEVLVEMNKVSVQYGSQMILRNINWKVKKGEFWQLTGPNGSGKTTLLTMITGDNPKAFGQDIRLFGKKKGSGESVWDIKKKIGYFTPSMTTLFHRRNSVEQMIISGMLDTIGLYRKPTGRHVEIARQWLQITGLENDRETSFLTIPQLRQRLVLIARAMIKHPPLLILDEPSTGLDDYSSSILVQLINKIAAECTTAILYVSHRKEEGLDPDYMFKLSPSPEGSEGKVVKAL